VTGSDNFMSAGAAFGVDLDGTDRDAVPTSGWRLRGNVAAYPLGFGSGRFTTAGATASTYVPLGFGGSHLAFRASGALAGGDFPAQYAASVGGSTTLRGYRWQRFAGDRSASATTELRIPIGALNFLIRSDVGVIALADAGRVWFDGQSDGGWHTGVGGGLWFAAFGHAATLAWAHGSEHRFYLKTGLPF
jgi:hemolysin activation/secretion protein